MNPFEHIAKNINEIKIANAHPSCVCANLALHNQIPFYQANGIGYKMANLTM